MAYTATQYREANVALRAELAKALGKQFVFLNLRDLDGSWPAYSRLAGESVAATAELANLTALDYFRMWLHDEMGEVLAERFLTGSVPVDLDEVARVLRLKGPIEVKRLIGAGWKPEEAWVSAMRQTVNTTAGYVHAIGQRSLTGLFAEYPHVLQGWRRIIGPNACSFCRKLERTVWHPSTQWEKPHEKCGCTAEPVPNSARVARYLTPLDKARNEHLRQIIVRRKDRERERRAIAVAAAA
jgi:hypothetical protein